MNEDRERGVMNFLYINNIIILLVNTYVIYLLMDIWNVELG